MMCQIDFLELILGGCLVDFTVNFKYALLIIKSLTRCSMSQFLANLTQF